MRVYKLLAAFFVLMGTALYGDTVKWIGTSSGLWTDPSNWDTAAVPAADGNVFFGKNVGLSISGAAVRVSSVEMAPTGLGGQILIANGAGSKLEVTGDLNQNGGVLGVRQVSSTPTVVIGGNYNATKGQLLLLQKVRSVHQLAVDGNLTAGPAFLFKFMLNGSKAFSAILVKGVTDLGGAKLELGTLANATCTESRLLLIQTASAKPLIGTFGDAIFNSTSYELNGQKYTLKLGDYDGGGVANDVYLEAEVK
jgi:hypothetical protein